MPRLFIIACLLFCLPVVTKAQFPTDSAKVYLITASPGEQTYAIFGHSALRVVDKIHAYEAVYNYGTFDFSTENFYLKFGTGKLMYFLSVSDYKYFLYAYNRNGQAIYLQEFNLTNKEKYTLINNLQLNSTEEHRYFRYDFFRDNCATRIRDIIEKSVDGKLVFDTNYVAKKESFRHLFGDYLESQPWTYFGLNLIMGKSTDSIASLSDYMYLPGHLKNLFTTAKIVSPEGTRNLTQAPVELFPTAIIMEKPSIFVSPVFICAMFFLVILLLTFYEYRNHKHYKGLDIFLFTVTGFLGILITWLWGWSLHIYVHNNLHIIWASPLNFIAAFLLIPGKKWLKYYFGCFALLVVLFILASLFSTQEIPFASYFLAGAMFVRALHLYYRYNKV